MAVTLFAGCWDEDEGGLSGTNPQEGDAAMTMDGGITSDGATDVDGGLSDAGEPLGPPRVLSSTPPGRTFRNPILAYGADPWVIYEDGAYLLIQSGTSGLTITRSETLTGLSDAEPVVIWEPGREGTPCCNWWAPELFKLDGKWYVYVAADNNAFLNTDQRMFALEADSPLGPYRLRGVIATQPDHRAIDGTILESGGQRYFVYAGYPFFGLESRLYIAPMSNPWTLSGPSVEIAAPTLPWERHPIPINEGPQVLLRGNRIHVVYSASAAFDVNYCLGVVTANVGSNLLSPSSWVKHPECIFSSNVEEAIYAPGHNSFVRSPDGSQIFNVYHAKQTTSLGFEDRGIHMQPIGWTVDDMPVLGRPVSRDTLLAAPFGEPGSSSARLEAEYGILEGGTPVFDATASSGQLVTFGASGSRGVRFPNLTADTAGTISLLVRYRSAGVTGTLEVRANGGSTTLVDYPATTGGDYGVVRVSVPVTAGENDLSFRVSSPGFGFDCIERE